LSIELEREESMTVRQWEEFLSLARRAGAADGTVVAEVTADHSEDILCSYRVERPDGPVSGPEQVVLPTWLVHDLLSVVKEVATSDGDVRGLETGAKTALQHAYDHLLLPVLGENPYSSAADKDSSE